MSTPFTLDNRAQSGFQNAALYDTHRPSYPPAAVSKLLTHLNLAGVAGAKIVDLACGTGKFTELLAKREEGFEVVGVEPHAGMREELVKKGLKGVEVRDGDAGNMGVEEEWADGVIAAQVRKTSFKFATEDSLKEIHRVLKPGGSYGMIWNVDDYNAPKDWPSRSKWQQKLKDIIYSLEDGQPRFRHLQWKQVFENQQDSSPLQALADTFTHHMPRFSLPIGEESVDWVAYLTDEAVWDRYSTLSQISNLKGSGRYEEVRKEVFDSLKAEGVERNAAGAVALHGKTFMAWTSRI
ncbi:putative methyltransferase-like [Lachnellula occidentalis]|uniref:Putative methyltransferase-like n=1 Tax=Lachnellula occidentalis TaxID=215460 RepID=A0A8H8S6M0_9HELO|nr:putative methyltransferase-like [Lachnellula occidentalis]